MANVSRDQRNHAELNELGWRVCIVWECSFRGKSVDEKETTIQNLISWLKDGGDFAEIQDPVVVN